MDRQAAIRALGAQLDTAAAARDWSALDVHARALGQRLSALAASRPWSAAERAALAQLQAAHGAAAAACDGAAEALSLRLEDMRTNKEGWIAYTLETETGCAEKT